MPNRIIRGDLLDSDRYNALTHDSERLLFMELLLLADDYGLVPVNFGFLRRRTTPCSAKSVEQVTQMVSALADADLIRCYQSDRGGQFAFIPRFDNRPQALKPKWPIPPAHVTQGAIESAQANSKGLYRKQQHTGNATATHSYVAPETETETETELKEKPRPTTEPHSADADSGPEVAVLTKPATRTIPNCPIAAVIEAYHAELPAAPRVSVRNSIRDGLISARWRQIFADGKATSRDEGLRQFREFFAYCRESKFLTGRVPPRSKDARPFLADLEWLMSPTNFAKTVEGRYHR